MMLTSDFSFSRVRPTKDNSERRRNQREQHREAGRERRLDKRGPNRRSNFGFYT